MWCGALCEVALRCALFCATCKPKPTEPPSKFRGQIPWHFWGASFEISDVSHRTTAIEMSAVARAACLKQWARHANARNAFALYISFALHASQVRVHGTRNVLHTCVATCRAGGRAAIMSGCAGLVESIARQRVHHALAFRVQRHSRQSVARGFLCAEVARAASTSIGTRWKDSPQHARLVTFGLIFGSFFTSFFGTNLICTLMSQSMRVNMICC